MRSFKNTFIGGITFALGYTLFHYWFRGELSLMGFFGGIVWVLTAMLLRYFSQKR